MIQVTCDDPSATLAVGRRLAGLVRPGDVLILSGELGCGKTLFTAGLGEGLGVDGLITSPSFVLVKRYDGFIPLIHADVYRLGSIAELDDLDLDEQIDDGVLVIEWGAAVRAALPQDHLEVRFEIHENGTRVLTFLPRGDWTDRKLEELNE